jgi:predicted glycosyltransferase
VSQIFNRPNLFITRQFLKAEHFLTQGLVCADHILFIEDSGHFAVPPHLATKLTFVGPVVRSFAYTSQDRLRARQELGIDDSTKVVSVFFDAQSGIGVPVFQIVLDAFDKLPLINKVLIWVAGSDTRRLQRRIGNRTDVLIKESDWQIDRLMVATDLAITKANYTTVLELDTLGVPSIGLLNGHNPVDEFYTRQRPSVIPLELSSLSVGMLTQRMISLLTSSFPIDKEDFDPTVRAIGTVRAAERIASYLSEFAPIPR